jgi:hypothetical protein
MGARSATASCVATVDDGFEAVCADWLAYEATSDLLWITQMPEQTGSAHVHVRQYCPLKKMSAKPDADAIIIAMPTAVNVF